MITILLALTCLASAAVLAILVTVEVREHRAARREADWEAHVEQAVQASSTPLYEAIAHEFAKDLDGDWLRFNQGSAS